MIGLRYTLSQRILEYVRVYADAHRYPPSVRNIQAGLGLASAATAQRHLRYLREAGFVTWEPGKRRTLRIVEQEGERA